MSDEEVIYEDMTVEELREELQLRGLTTTGNKADLVARLDEDDAAHGIVVNGDEEAPAEEVEVPVEAVVETTETALTAREAFDLAAKELEDAGREHQLALADASAAERHNGEIRAAEAKAEAEAEKAEREAEKIAEKEAKAEEQAEAEAEREAEKEAKKEEANA